MKTSCTKKKKKKNEINLRIGLFLRGKFFEYRRSIRFFFYYYNLALNFFPGVSSSIMPSTVTNNFDEEQVS